MKKNIIHILTTILICIILFSAQAEPIPAPFVRAHSLGKINISQTEVIEPTKKIFIEEGILETMENITTQSSNPIVEIEVEVEIEQNEVGAENEEDTRDEIVIDDSKKDEELDNLSSIDTAPKRISLGEYKLTAYCPCEQCSGEWGNLTATGVRAEQGRTIAVDPKIIPYGSEIEIDGKVYVAEDCGGAIKGNRIDVYFDSHEEAWDFGIQYAEVFLIQ